MSRLKQALGVNGPNASGKGVENAARGSGKVLCLLGGPGAEHAGAHGKARSAEEGARCG